jgi:hypothetical protein
MAVSATTVGVSPGEAFGYLADPFEYPNWLVGARRILAVDTGFPTPGTSFRHEVGFGPLRLRDVSTAEAYDPDHCSITLRVRARPLLGAASVVLSARRDGPHRTVMTIEEEPRRLPFKRLLGPLADRLIRSRNDRSLERLREQLEP